MSFAISGDQFSMGHDMETFSSELESHPKLENWGSLTAESQNEIEKAAASLENLEKQYTGNSVLIEHPPEWSSPSETVVNNDRTELETFYKGVPSGGSTDIALGGESLDAAEAGGLISSSALGIAGGLLPLAATLTYEDFATGSNFVTNALFSGKEDYETWQSEAAEQNHDVAASEMTWIEYVESEAQRTLEWNSTVAKELKPSTFWIHSYLAWEAKCPSGPKYLEHGSAETCFPSEATLPHSHKLSEYNNAAYGGSCPFGGSFAGEGEQFAMAAKIGSEYFLGNCEGQSIESLTVHNGPATCGSVCLKNWSALESECFAISGGKAESPGSIAGWPIQVGPYVTFGKTQEYCQIPFGPFKGYENETTIDRHRSRMHIGLPRTKTETEVKKLEEEGHKVNHGEGHKTTTSTEPTVVKKIAVRSKGGGQRRREKSECHVLGCETEKVEPKVESEAEPAEPAKPEGSSPSVPGTLEVPSCFLVEMSGTACASLLKSEGFTNVEIDVRTWEHAVVTKPAEAVVSVSPAAGSVVETSTKLVVESNPDAAHMPALVPAIKYGTETGAEYKKRLEEEGWTKVEIKILPETAIDPKIGPSKASYTVPKAETAVDPDKTTKVEVEANPETAPNPAEETSGISGPTLPGFRLPNFGVTCKGFPFGVPCWLIKTIETWSASASCPVWSIGEYTVHGKKIPEASINLCSFGLEKLMETVRPAMLIFATLGLVILFYTFAKGGSPPSGGGAKDVTTEYDGPNEYRVGW